jgi:hypothetical protein
MAKRGKRRENVADWAGKDSAMTLKSSAAMLAAALAGLLLAAPALAQSCKPARADMAGLYTLRGVMETGSQIMLHADGRFQYMLAYGATDELAEGCWQRVNDVVILTTTKMQVSQGGNRFSRLSLPVVDGGKLARQFGQRMGMYERGRR